MKTTSKTLLSLVAFLFTMALPSNAQLKVQSNGRIMTNYSTGTALSPLSIGGVGNQGYQVYIDPTGNRSGLFVNCKNYKSGISIDGCYGPGWSNAAINVSPSGVSGPSSTVYSLHAYSGVTDYGTSIGLAGAYLDVTGNIANKAAGIYGSSSAIETFSYSGIYAGYFNGDVRVTGTLYGTLLTPSSISNPDNLEEGTTMTVVNTDATDDSKSSDESISSKLRHVQLLQLISHKERISTEWTNKSSIKYPASADEPALTPEELEKLVKDNEGAPLIQTEMASTRYELAVDQLRDVFPELVYEDKDGNISINYMEMIPLLVGVVNELRSEIEVLKGNTSETKSRSDAASITTTDDVTLYLGQNNPNPFSEQTSIEVRIPNDVKTAFLCIYDMNGKQIDKIVINERGTTRISILGTSLTEGMYLYSLIADGKVAGTKKMILTK